MDIVFVILHYKTDRDTIECVESIRSKIDTAGYRIVIVDNASANGSYEALQKEYSGADDIALISNSENLGFARGLNVGIDYARKHFDPDFIALINNDTQLISKNITETINQKYRDFKFAVFGPMMITADGLCDVNPVRNKPRDLNQTKAMLAHYRQIQKMCNLHLYWLYVFLQKHKRKKPKAVKTAHLSDQVDWRLHGAFMVLSREYFSEFEGLNPETFLYTEEEILLLSILKKGLHTLYSPDVIIYHKENSSTDSQFPNSAERARFVSKHSIDSLNINIKMLNG